MESKALTSSLKYFEVKNNQLYVNGHTISDIADNHGSPLYIYDTSVIEKKCRLFRKHMPEDICLYYAVKANPNIEILKFVNKFVDGFDIASSGEMKAVLRAGGKPENISFAGPGKNRDELKESIEQGVGSINVESESEIDLIVQESRKLNITPNISIRINPDFELRGSGMKMGGGSKQFGIDAEKLPDIMQKIKKLPVDFQGFHVFAGSQNLDAASICKTFEKTMELMQQATALSNSNIKLLNFGGGFGIPYFKDDEELDIEQLGNRLSSLMQSFRQSFPETGFIIELGRYIVGECGLYVTEILYKKESRGKIFLITDGGMNHHLAASGNLGQILRKNYPILLAAKVKSDKKEKVNIAGPLCTPIDSIGVNIELPQAREGDYIVFMNSGAYGFTASPLLFLSHSLPSEFIIKN